MQPPEPPPFEFGCSTLPFGALEYAILARQGNRLGALLRGDVPPSTPSEEHFIRCVREGGDYDSHQCVAADAWVQLVERRAFEHVQLPPGPNRTWVRPCELRDGMILVPPGRRTAALLVPSPRFEHRSHGGSWQYRNGRDFPWHQGSEGGRWRVAVSLRDGKQSELLVESGELLEVADGLDRVMVLVAWKNRGDDIVVAEAEWNEVYYLPPDRVSYDFLEPEARHPDSLIRVQWWNREPLWVWGYA